VPGSEQAKAVGIRLGGSFRNAGASERESFTALACDREPRGCAALTIAEKVEQPRPTMI
jgi:hypothetical protein